jgi:hypothetical protein
MRLSQMAAYHGGGPATAVERNKGCVGCRGRGARVMAAQNAAVQREASTRVQR